MMATRTIGLALGMIGGIVLATITGWTIPLLALLVFGLLGLSALAYEFLLERKWREWPATAIFLAAFICAMPLGYWRTMTTLGTPSDNTLRSVLSRIDGGSAITVRGTICHQPELRKAGQVDIILRVNQLRIDTSKTSQWTRVKSGKLLVRVYAQKSSTALAIDRLNTLAGPDCYGYTIELSSRYNPVTKTLNPGQFDYGKFLQAGGLATRLRAHINRVKILKKSRGNPLTELALLAKSHFIKTYKRTISAPASLLVSAATLGTRRVVEHVKYRGHDISQMFRHAGVGHVLAVSGIHVSVVTILLFSLFRMTGIRVKVFVPPLILFLILFALLTGARPSSLRAVIMNSVVLITIAYFPCGIRKATAIGLAISSFFILAFNPTVLFAPSFLLSYGAVISLILLSPPMDHWLCTFRGFSLFFLIAWIVFFTTIAVLHFHWLINSWNILAMFGLLWLLKIAGNRLNHRYPKAWGIGLEKIPTAMRLFLFAQFAIQIGMMIPMSSWFFGQFPIAGMLVNLVAIPLVAIIVQIGMLTGLVGLVPFIGAYLALPFGATVTVVANIFYLAAYAGTVLFPYPATPRPTLTWLALYYAAVAAIILCDTFRVNLLALLYRFFPKKPESAKAFKRIWILPLVLMALPLFNVVMRTPECTSIQCLASGNHPIITMASSDRSATIINAGADLTGERLIFDTLRSQGVARVKTAVLCSADPRAGIEGCASLLNKMNISQCLLAFMPTNGQSYIESIGDPYLIKQQKEASRWVKNYNQNFATLEQKLKERKGTMEVIKDNQAIASWNNGSIKALTRYKGKAKRFAASATSPILSANINGISWLIVTDTSYAAVKALIPHTTHYDIIVVPDLSSRTSYEWWLKYLLKHATPKLLIISGEKSAPKLDINQLLKNTKSAKTIVFCTAIDGAVGATFQPDGTTELTTHLTGRTMTISPTL